jgi:hypothetical protein
VNLSFSNFSSLKTSICITYSFSCSESLPVSEAVLFVRYQHWGKCFIIKKIGGDKMQKALSAELKRVSKDKIRFEITKDNYESFCNAVGLYKKEFIEILRKTEADHKAGRVTKRKSLLEITEKA